MSARRTVLRATRAVRAEASLALPDVVLRAGRVVTGRASGHRALDGRTVALAAPAGTTRDVVAGALRARGADVVVLDATDPARDLPPRLWALVLVVTEADGDDGLLGAATATHDAFFPAVRALLAAVPAMRRGRVVGLLVRDGTRTPGGAGARAALDAALRCAAPELLHGGPTVTTARARGPEGAARAALDALVHAPKRTASRRG